MQPSCLCLYGFLKQHNLEMEQVTIRLKLSTFCYAGGTENISPRLVV